MSWVFIFDFRRIFLWFIYDVIVSSIHFVLMFLLLFLWLLCLVFLFVVCVLCFFFGCFLLFCCFVRCIFYSFFSLFSNIDNLIVYPTWARFFLKLVFLFENECSTKRVEQFSLFYSENVTHSIFAICFRHTVSYR